MSPLCTEAMAGAGMHIGVAKTLINLAFSENKLTLSFDERDYLVKSAGIDRYYLPPRLIIKFVIKEPNFKYNLVNCRSFAGKAFKRHPTFVFMSEILKENRDYRDTYLYSRVKRGKRCFSRKIFGPKESRRISSEDDVKLYYDYCLNLAESIRTYGFLDKWCADPGLIKRFNLQVRGSPISLAINKDGKLLHYAKGYHRLAIAQLLEVERIPVTIACVSAAYFKRFSDGWMLTERRFVDCLSRAVNHSIEQATRSRAKLTHEPDISLRQLSTGVNQRTA
jgi:hypothetical protein